MNQVLNIGPEYCKICQIHGFIGDIHMGYCYKCAYKTEFKKYQGHFLGYELRPCNCYSSIGKQDDQSLQNEIKTSFFGDMIPQILCTECHKPEDPKVYFQTFTKYLDLRLTPTINLIKTIKSPQEFRNIARKYVFAHNLSKLQKKFVSPNQHIKCVEMDINIIQLFLQKNKKFKKNYYKLFEYYNIQ